MICHAVKEAVSVRADGELQLDPTLTNNEVDTHLETCSDCMAFEASTRQVKLALRIESATDMAEMADLSSAILDALPKTPSRRRRLGQAALVAASVGAVAAMSAVNTNQGGDLVADQSPTARSSTAALEFRADQVGLSPTSTVLSALKPTRVVWSPTLFDDQTARRIEKHQLFSGASIVGLSQIDISLGDDTSTALEVLSFDPVTYPHFVDEPQRASFASLGVGQAVVSESAAAAHGLQPGDTLAIGDDLSVIVAAVVANAAIADAEIAVVNDAIADIGAADRFNFVLVDSETDNQTIEEALESEIGDRPIVAKPVSGDSPARPVAKDLPELATDNPEVDSADPNAVQSTSENPPNPPTTEGIKRANVPVLGEIRCHTKTITALSAAMTRLQTRGLATLIDPETFVTCHEPGLTLMTIGHPDHQTGMAVDIYVDDDGVIRPVDRRVRKVLANFGFSWAAEHATHFQFDDGSTQQLDEPTELLASEE